MLIDTLFDVPAITATTAIPTEVPRSPQLPPNDNEVERDANAALNATRANNTPQPTSDQNQEINQDQIPQLASTATANSVPTTATTTSAVLAPSSSDSTSGSTPATQTETLPELEAEYLASVSDLLEPDPNAPPAADAEDHVNILA